MNQLDAPQRNQNLLPGSHSLSPSLSLRGLGRAITLFLSDKARSGLTSSRSLVFSGIQPSRGPMGPASAKHIPRQQTQAQSCPVSVTPWRGEGVWAPKM